MNKSFISFFASLLAFLLMSGGCHLLGGKRAEKEGFSEKRGLASVMRPSQSDRPSGEPSRFNRSAGYSQPMSLPVFEFRVIPKGKFKMGSPDNEEYRRKDEKQVPVEISKPFEIMTKEVTQKQWFQVTRKNPSRFKRPGDCRDYQVIDGVGMCPNHPVERVSWKEVQEYIKKLNAFLGLRGCKGGPKDPRGCLRLPTEAEWEYAARAGKETAYFFGNDSSVLGNYAWYSRNSGGRTHRVGTRSPNPWKLYDMYGNVWEWVQDGYRKSLPGGKDPLVTGGSYRVLRGGSWDNDAWYLRSAYRAGNHPDYGFTDVGLRLVRDFVSL